MGVSVLNKFSKRIIAGFLLPSGALLLAGCSSDVGRFDYPLFGLAEDQAAGEAGYKGSYRSGGYGGIGLNGGNYQYSTGQREPALQQQKMAHNKHSGGADYRPGDANGGYDGYAYDNQRSEPNYRDTAGAGDKAPAQPYERRYNDRLTADAPRAETQTGNQGYQPPSYEVAPANPAASKPEPAQVAAPASDGGYGDYFARPSSGAGQERSGERKAEQVAALKPAPSRQQAYDRAPAPAAQPLAARAVEDDARISGSHISGSHRVAPGDTLYSISRKAGVDMKTLMKMNGMADSSLRVGQVLQLPGGARTARSAAKPAAKPVARATRTATYQVAPGDTVYSIARRHGVKPSRLASMNGISDGSSIRVGEELMVPGNASVESAPSPTRQARVASAPAPGPAKRVRPQPSAKSIAKSTRKDGVAVRSVKIQTIRIGGVANDAAPAATKPGARVASLGARAKAAAADRQVSNAPKNARFRWPVRGEIIARFGDMVDGDRNDGVNLAVPRGAQVKAAEDGVVAYAGSELKGYGKLILIRHSDNWVSAYAHNDELLVKRGAKIKRGQVISRAGQSGGKDRPQLHFELRKNSKPVDPLGYIRSSS